MDHQKRMILVIAIMATIIVGVVSGFRLPFLLKTPSIVLPESEGGNISGDGTQDPGDNADYILLRVTKDTVQEVIRTLNRQAQYRREMKIEKYYSEGSGTKSTTYTVLVWNDGAYSKTMIMGPDGSPQHCLTAEDTAYIWYGGDASWIERPIDLGKKDLLQNIPTYEDVLQLDADSIVRASYENRRGKNCIYVEARQAELGLLERYWIATDTGLLYDAETVREADGRLWYSMSETSISSLTADDTTFMLPNGKVLHSVVVPETQE